MKKSIVLFGIVLSVCFSCSNVKETPKGFPFTVIRRGDGVLPKPGQFLVMNMLFKDGKDSVWNNTRTGEPMVVMIQDTTAMKFEDGVDEVFRLISKGDSIAFKVPAQTLFEKTFRQPIPPNIDPKSEFSFNMGVTKIVDREEVMKMQQEIVARQNERFMKEQKEQVKKDVVAIDEYLSKNMISALQDSSGLRYVITQPGTGPKPAPTDTVVVMYVGKLMENGTIFDQSKAPVTFGLSNLIKGWQLGFPLLNTGSKATLYVPSALAYGSRGYPPRIPENANLVFEVELIGIK